ncbi:MAG: lipopolysaccharide biosynthesis protein RfbH [Bdellovibrionales bacterium]|nr:lipopolysaccharide biosynthesis protein RfbH [Bdellovibrionales bacterium]
MAEKEEKLRRQILDLVKDYYREVHKPAGEVPFVPGESFLGYAGRIFDEVDMQMLVDSSLDFYLTAGRFAKQFERAFAKKLGVKHSLLVNSGSSANLVAFNALTSPLVGERRVRPGDEVICVAASFPTTVNPAIQYGAIPVFLDVTVEDGTYNLDVSQLEEALSPRTRAVMVAHTLGNPFNLGAVLEFCQKNDLWLVEDNCDALGSLYDGQLTGTFGDIGTSSFYPAHHITMGEGGAVYMRKGMLKRAAESIRDWGRDCWCESGKDNTCGKRFCWQLGELPDGYDHKYTYSHFGYNLKVSDMQAAVGCSQLEKLDSFTEIRRRNWQLLRDGLADLEELFILPNATPRSEPSWFGFLLSVRDGVGFARNEITSFLEERKIQTRNLFAGNLLRQPVFDEMRATGTGYRVIGDLRNSDFIMTNSFWLGVYPGLSEEKIEYMVQSVRDFVDSSIRAPKTACL